MVSVVSSGKLKMDFGMRWTVSFLGIAGFLFSVSECYIMDKCYCWDELNTILMEKLSSIPPSQSPSMYTYVGAKAIANDEFMSCSCKDVTRMKTLLKIEDEEIRDRSSNLSEIQGLERNITDGFISILDVRNQTQKIHNVSVTFKDVPDTPVQRSIWNLEVVFKGRNVSAEDLESTIKQKTINQDETYTLPTVGNFLADDFVFNVLRCEGEPPSRPASGIRNWLPSQQYPGDMATYDCDEGYFLVDEDRAFSVCRHDNIIWSIPEVNLTCQKGCKDKPPDGPFFTVRDWTTSLRTDGDRVNYACMNRYKSVTGKNGSSTCTDSKWTPVESDFKCEQMLCPMKIPQVPMYGNTDWDKSTRYIKTRIQYFCKEEYCPTIKGEVFIDCEMPGKWTPLPDSYHCVHNDYALQREVRSYDYYLDGPNQEKDKQDNNWFFYITVPSMIGLVLIIICCLCCTRADSPIFLPCSRYSGKTFYFSK